MYKVIIFDLDNTLLDFDYCALDSMKRAVQHHNIMEQEGFLWDSFWETFQKNSSFYWEKRFTRNLSNLEALEFALRDTFGDFGPPSLAVELTRTYWEFFCNTCHFEDGAPEILQWAHTNYKLGIISNGAGEAQHRRLQSGHVYHLFENITISDEVGFWKPDPNIFHVALEQLNAGHHEALFVGDSLRDDYFGALNSGIDFCFYNRKRQQLEEHMKPKYCINTLLELKNMI